MIWFLPLPPSHPFANFVVFFCDRLIILEVAARPPLFANLLLVQLALFVAVDVVLASARATESLFFFFVSARWWRTCGSTPCTLAVIVDLGSCSCSASLLRT